MDASKKSFAFLYSELKDLAKRDLGSLETSAKLLELTRFSLEFLDTECDSVELNSLVSGKTYFSYALKTKKKLLSRPINRDLFLSESKVLTENWSDWKKMSSKNNLVGPLLYTMAIAYSVASDLFDRANKKGPATYFECLIGHIFAREINVNPTKKVSLSIMGRSIRMTMDFVFDLGSKKPKIHLPVKMSTRERVVQAWAHQKILDAAFGRASYRGILVVHSETKLDLKKREVVEICVPDQWLVYQNYLAVMDRIYYFDMPDKYAQLGKNFPIIPLKLFVDFFTEKEIVLSAPMV